ncbi:oxidative damage protection protein [Candidatus Methylospira mobilis]|uniref:Probable Fe(2+)-trafficking protein n=1 Tax=Candidatus Methylospira mobilis TaxID=1808979 RepID=A0A5Q0BMM2_9GAMM|nr:oxidative damage protection protein [Candidatus Methylospira mobilis]QFY43491.1 oxidative damage protection protein [Candidatus Methylospira mobilis]WNV03967.1 oxidative damage protection protein [Candidatus Methylospira mobilis]
MTNSVTCAKYGTVLEGLDKPPFPGEQGLRIQAHISKQAWQEWLKLQTMLINEHRLTPFDSQHKQFLAQEREKFLFGTGADLPQGYMPPAEVKAG